MLNALMKFIEEMTDGRKDPGRFEESDYRLSAAALLIHTATIDGAMSDVEREKLHSLVKQRFKLDDDRAGELLEAAANAELNAVDLYSFTSLLNRMMDEASRARVVEMMWEVVYSDGRVSEFEDNLLWRAADLLHVPARERIALRRRVAGIASDKNQ
jgi:uncharacterized tellurite resistance protein B-like protein